MPTPSRIAFAFLVHRATVALTRNDHSASSSTPRLAFATPGSPEKPCCTAPRYAWPADCSYAVPEACHLASRRYFQTSSSSNQPQPAPCGTLFCLFLPGSSVRWLESEGIAATSTMMACNKFHPSLFNPCNMPFALFVDVLMSRTEASHHHFRCLCGFGGGSREALT